MSHSRYWMERAIQDAKCEAGLDEYELRSWRGWHHHMTMTILAMLSVERLFLVYSNRRQVADKLISDFGLQSVYETLAIYS